MNKRQAKKIVRTHSPWARPDRWNKARRIYAARFDMFSFHITDPDLDNPPARRFLRHVARQVQRQALHELERVREDIGVFGMAAMPEGRPVSLPIRLKP